MKVYFTDVIFQEKPLIWVVNEKENSATCTFKILGNTNKIAQKTIIEELKHQHHTGLIIEGDKATIPDFQSFKIKHIPCTVIKIDEMPLSSPSFFWHCPPAEEGSPSSRERIMIPTSKTLRLKRATSANNADKRGLNFKNNTKEMDACFLDLESLCPENDSSQRGITVVYDNFEQKNTSDAQNRSNLYLKTEISFKKELQYQNNSFLLLLKSEFLKNIRDLMNNHVNKAYMIWRHDFMGVHCKQIYHYFRDAVNEAMSDERFNTLPTEFENLSPYEIKEKFNNNTVLFELANHKIRKLRAELAMIKFNVLVDDELPMEAACSTEELVQLLTSFKEFLHGYECCLKTAEGRIEKNKVYLEIKDQTLWYTIITPAEKEITHPLKLSTGILEPLSLGKLAPLFPEILQKIAENGHARPYLQINILENIKSILSSMIGLKIEMGEVILKNAKKTLAFEQELQNVKLKFGDFYSFQGMIFSFLETKFSEYNKKKSEENSKACSFITSEITSIVISNIINTFMRKKLPDYRIDTSYRQFIASLSSNDTNFFLCESWALIFEKQLNKMDVKDLCKHKEKSKKILHFAEQITECISTLIANKLKAMEKTEGHEGEKPKSALSISN